MTCPFCRETAPDLLEVWRGQGFCSACGRIWRLDEKPVEKPVEKPEKPEQQREVA